MSAPSPAPAVNPATAPTPAPGAASPARDGDGLPGRRHQPPLQEVLKGLEARELEGQTVFDALFGETDPRPGPQ